MSHFSVIVATKEEPTDEVLRRALQPYHQYECTGIDDEFVQNVDITAEARERWSSDMVGRLRDPDGNLHSPYEDRFYRDPTPEELKEIGPIAGSGGNGNLSWSSQDWGDGRGYRTKVRFVPEGWSEVDVPRSQVESFAEFVNGWYGLEAVPLGQEPDVAGSHSGGYMLLDADGGVATCIDRTNPNAKWDWWRVGGRYAGKFQKKGRLRANRSDLSWEWRDADDAEIPSGVDICRKSEIDVEAMKAAASASRRHWWLKCCEQSTLSSDDLLKALSADRVVHAKWLSLPKPRPQGSDYAEWSNANGGYKAVELMRLCDKPEISEGQSLEDWFNATPFLTCFAFLMDGKWAEKGEMGWWAFVSNENENWHEDFMRIFSAIPSDYWLTVVDCHI